jgi:hypothetical protein
MLDDAERKRAALNMVRLCHDFVPVGSNGKLYLSARRQGNAISEIPGSPWFVGGAMTPFMDERASMQTVLKRELGHEFDLTRLIYLQTNRYYMNGIAQGGFAHDAYCFIYALPLAAEEIASAKLDDKEFDAEGLKPYTITDLEQIQDDMTREIFVELWNCSKMSELRARLVGQ